MQKTQHKGIIFILNYLDIAYYLIIIDFKGKKIKSVRRDGFGSKVGRLHMTKQDVNSLQTRKMKGLKKTYAEKKLKRNSDAEKNGPPTKRPKVTSSVQSKKLKKFSKKGRKLKGGQV